MASKAKPSGRKAAGKISLGHESAAAERPLKIGEAARAIGVEPYVLRFWETQFSFLRPRHAASGHRSYDPRDLETLRLIKRLLHAEGFTIAGAKKHIREHGLERLRAETPKASKPAVQSAPAAPAATPPVNGAALNPADAMRLRKALAEIRHDLESLHKFLQS